MFIAFTFRFGVACGGSDKGVGLRRGGAGQLAFRPALLRDLQLLQPVILGREDGAADDGGVLGVRQGGIEERPVVDARATAAGKVRRPGVLLVTAELMHNPPGDACEMGDGFRAVQLPDFVRDVRQLVVLGFAEGGHVVRSEL